MTNCGFLELLAESGTPISPVSLTTSSYDPRPTGIDLYHGGNILVNRSHLLNMSRITF